MTEDKKEEQLNKDKPTDSASQTESDEISSSDQTTELPEANFLQLVFLLGTQALYGLGAIPNPVTKKTEPDLLVAKFNIDLLNMLQEKTKGNLTEGEAKGLEELLFDLRMRYVVAVKEPQESSQ